MTDEAKALVERSQNIRSQMYLDLVANDQSHKELLDLIETQAAEIERLKSLASDHFRNAERLARELVAANDKAAKWKALAEELDEALGEAVTWNSHDDEGVPAVWLGRAEQARTSYKEQRDAS